MKLRLLAIFAFISNIIFSQNFHDTQGKLEISSNGQSTYTLPIQLPPSIQNVGPTINLVYASGQMGGIVGQGWNISGISSISRISTRIDIDGYVDGVDFDTNDMLTLDGKRLILSSGNYWADGSTYQTEVLSNMKIELKGSGASLYFIVTAPDGSRSWYGNFGGTNAVDLTSFYITRYEDTNGNFITYHYINPDSVNTLCISEIKFSANTNGLTTPLNSIKFNYKIAKRTESGYIKGLKIEKKRILDNIEVKTNNLIFKKHQITHVVDSQLGYERVSQIQEFNGANEAANPVVFDYQTTTSQSVGSEVQTTYYNNLDFNSIDLSGDFDGDGRLDFATNNAIHSKLFQSSSSGTISTFPTSMYSSEQAYYFNIINMINSQAWVLAPDIKRTTATINHYLTNKIFQKQSILAFDTKLNEIKINIHNLNESNQLLLDAFISIPISNEILYTPALNQLSASGRTD